MDEKIVNKYIRIAERAAHPGTPPHEADTCRNLMRQMEMKYPGIAEAAALRTAPPPGGFRGPPPPPPPPGGFGGAPGGFTGTYNPWDLFTGGAASPSDFLRNAAGAAGAAVGAAAGSYAAGTVSDALKADVARVCTFDVQEKGSAGKRGVKFGGEPRVVMTIEIPMSALERLTERAGFEQVCRAVGVLVAEELIDSLEDDDDGD